MITNSRRSAINHSSQVVKPPNDPRKLRIVSRVTHVIPGNKIGDGTQIHGGGGPENRGAQPSTAVAIVARESRPSWSTEDNLGEYIGYAATSVTPNMAGIPANNFRGLGDNHGGRQ